MGDGWVEVNVYLCTLTKLREKKFNIVLTQSTLSVLGNAAWLLADFFPQLGLFADILFLSLISAGENYKEGARVGAQRPILRVDEPIKTSVQGMGE